MGHPGRNGGDEVTCIRNDGDDVTCVVSERSVCDLSRALVGATGRFETTVSDMSTSNLARRRRLDFKHGVPATFSAATYSLLFLVVSGPSTSILEGLRERGCCHMTASTSSSLSSVSSKNLSTTPKNHNQRQPAP